MLAPPKVAGLLPAVCKSTALEQLDQLIHEIEILAEMQKHYDALRDFYIGQRVQVIGCGYGVIMGTWRDWIQVQLDVCGMVGKKAAQLRIA